MPIPDDLTTLESKLVDAASGGGIAGPEPPYHVLAGASWPRELTVRAELLRALLVSGPPTTVSADRPLQLRGARILGAVDLEAATIQRPVRFDGCYFLDAINLSEATTRSVSLVNCQLAGMSADQVEIRGNLGLASTICVGELRLRAARITGDLLLDGAKLYGSGGIALDGLGLFVQQAVTGKTRFEAYGTVSLYRADIGDLNLNGAKLTAPAGHALYAEVLRVRGSIMCGAGFESKGAVWLAGAAVGGQLLLNGAKLSNPGGNALVGDGLKVEGDLRLRLGFETNGELRLVGADVRGAVEVSGSHLRNPGGVALNGDHLRVGRSMFYNGTTIEGAVWLEEAHIGGSIEMDGASLHNPGDVALKGTGLVVDQNVVCSRGFTANGQLQFDGARIGGNLEFEKARWMDRRASPSTFLGLVLANLSSFRA
jgi:hypothetical protein